MKKDPAVFLEELANVGQSYLSLVSKLTEE